MSEHLYEQALRVGDFCASVQRLHLEGAALALVAPHVAVCGVGKSGIVANYMAACLRAHGAPASCLDPVAAMHGDIGGFDPDATAFVAISASGETEELLKLADARVHRYDVAILGRVGSRIGAISDIVVNTAIDSTYDKSTGCVPSVSFTVACIAAAEIARIVAEKRNLPGLSVTHPGGALAVERPWR